MPIIHPQAEALVHLARKRRLLDVAGCARLRILLGERNVATMAEARQFLTTSALVSEAVAASLLSALPSAAVTALGPYQILAHLADGGMGSVWLVSRRDDDGRHTTPGLDRPQAGEVVVAKSLHARSANSQEGRLRFDREARLMAEVRHPHIVGIRDLDVTTEGVPFLVMDFVESGDLKDLVEQQGRLPEALALAIVYQVAEALAAAHERAIIHRDIKPANIFVRPDGWAALADFGMARSTDDQRTMLTMAGTVLGSPMYMSPEQIRGADALDIRSDLYALGCVLHYCLIGRVPYDGATLQDILHQHLTAAIPRVRALRSDLSARTAAVIERLMCKDRDGRFRTPSEACWALSDALAGLTPARAATEPARVNHVLAPASSSESTVSIPPADRPWDPRSLLTTSGDEGRSSYEVSSEQDLTLGMDVPWIALSGDHGVALLYARHALTLGKLCEPPVDICLRKYPVGRFRDDCLRIGRNHLRLQFNATAGRVELVDLGSTHGTTMEGIRLTPNRPTALEPGRRLSCQIAGSLALSCQIHARSTDVSASTSTSGSSPTRCGIDQGYAIDACTITRPDNQTDMSYAMVLRRLTIGAPDAHLPLPGVMRAVAEIALLDGRWIWRLADQDPWQPLTAETELVLDGQRFQVGPGRYELFIGDG